MDDAHRPSGLSALNDDERREYWATLALRHTRGLGVRAACQLLRHFGSAYEAVMNVPLWPEAGVPAQKAEGYLNNEWRRTARPEWEASRTLRGSIILWTDKRYPELLKELPDAPALFYARGDTALLRAPCVAVVGSRNASSAALDFASAIAADLSEAGVTVVSGLAFGVDGCAHRAALSGPGRTIAVMAGGVDFAQPARHEGLYRSVAEHGLIISEMPPGTTPGPGSFPIRNRIISGMSLGVLVAEAGSVRSGSLITARLATEQGRTVYVPSPDALRAPYREGTKKLLLDGARAVFQAGDILADLFPHLKHALRQVPEGRPQKPEETPTPPSAVSLPPQPTAAAAPAKKEEQTSACAAPKAPARKTVPCRPQVSSTPLTEEEATILELLRECPLSPDELLYAAQEQSPAWTSASVSAVLMVLEVKKLARRLADSRYEARA